MAETVAAVPQKLGTIANVEAVINEWTRGQARKKGVRETCFRVNLVENLSRGDMLVLGGPLVQIQLKWPMDLSLAKAKLNSALALIQRRGLYTPLAVATHAYFQKEGVVAKKWIQKQLEKVNVEEVVEELIPIHRVRVTRSVVVTYTDTLTGAEISVTEKQAPEPYRSQYINEWLTLSRLANASVTASGQSAVSSGGSVPDSPAVGPADGEAVGSEDHVAAGDLEVLLDDASEGGAE